VAPVSLENALGTKLFRRPFVKRFALCYGSVVCLSVPCVCLSVTLVYCVQTVGWIKMKLGMEVGLVPGHIVLDGNPAPLPKGYSLPNFRSVSVVAKRLDGSRCRQRCIVSRPWSWSRGELRTWKMVLDLVLAQKSRYFQDLDEWYKPHYIGLSRPNTRQELIRRWDSERELLRSVPGSYSNSLK